MDHNPASPLLQRRREVLRQASIALGDRPVTLWSLRQDGVPGLELASGGASALGPATRDLDSTLGEFHVLRRPGSFWIGCQLGPSGRWRVAPVRLEPPAPPPDGVERRSRERITLELAGLCLGMIERANGLGSVAPLADAALEDGLAALDTCLDGIRAMDGLDLAERGRLLRELANVAESIERAVAALERN